MGSLCWCVLLASLFFFIGFGVCYRPQCLYLVIFCALLLYCQVHLMCYLWYLHSQVYIWLFPHGHHAPLGI